LVVAWWCGIAKNAAYFTLIATVDTTGVIVHTAAATIIIITFAEEGVTARIIVNRWHYYIVACSFCLAMLG
jgi:hypothetical protein